MSIADGTAQKRMRLCKLGWFLIGSLLLGVGCSKPLYTRVTAHGEQRWAKALEVEADKQAAVKLAAKKAGIERDEAIDFGRQLDTITSFYETLITLLLSILAVVTAVAVWTIKVISKAQAEEVAKAAALEILGGHDDFRNRLKEEVKKQLEFEMDVVREQFASGGVSEDAAVVNPEHQPSRRR